MANELSLRQATASDMTNTIQDYSVPLKNTDGVSSTGETEYINTNWAKWWGYFNAMPALKSAILMKAIWSVGKGWTSDTRTKIILEHITGWGKDTFDDILFNLEVVRYINGDAFAEIIRDEETGILINLKPLDPSSIKIIVDSKGIIKRYEQISKLGDGKAVKKFMPEEIFHLSCDRLADQIHGISKIEALEPTIKAEMENFNDMRKLMHYQGKPFILWKLQTDDPTKIAEIKSKIDNARNLGEDMFIPDDDDAVKYEIVQLNPSQMILQWANSVNQRFYRALGMPLLLFGQAGSTESGGKVEYLGHEQVFEYGQRYIENQIWQQLGLKLNLIPPTSLLENLQADEAKDAGFQTSVGINPAGTEETK